MSFTRLTSRFSRLRHCRVALRPDEPGLSVGPRQADRRGEARRSAKAAVRVQVRPDVRTRKPEANVNTTAGIPALLLLIIRITRRECDVSLRRRPPSTAARVSLSAMRRLARRHPSSRVRPGALPETTAADMPSASVGGTRPRIAGRTLSGVVRDRSSGRSLWR